MNAKSDQQLLHVYADRRSEAAFEELVRRHIDFVHSAALRMVNDRHLAQDVTQGVFVALAKDAGKLKSHPVLSGWLHRTARNIAGQTVRTEARRRTREMEAAAMNENPQPDVLWEEIAPHLDAALAELSEPDRDAVLLRYFENKPADEMSAMLGISADAAQKRVSRAVERLRGNFAKRGITSIGASLAANLSAHAVQVAPAGLATSISTAALASTSLTSITSIAMTTLQKSAIAATLVLAIAARIGWQNHQQQLDQTRKNQAAEAAMLGNPLDSSNNAHLDDISKSRRERTKVNAKMPIVAAEFTSFVKKQIETQGEECRDADARYNEFINRMTKLDASQFKALIGNFINNKGIQKEIRYEVGTSLLKTLSEQHPQVALDFFSENIGSLKDSGNIWQIMTSLIKKRAEDDPSAAMEWFNNNRESFLDFLPEYAELGIIDLLNSPIAAQRALALPSGEARDATLRQIYEDWQKKDPVEAASFAKKNGMVK